MKLTSVRDRWERSQDDQSEDDRRFHSAQAAKHADDVCRIVVMTTLGERDGIAAVRALIEESEPFQEARRIFIEFFKDKSGVGTQLVAANWEPSTLGIIQGTLSSWFE